MIWSFDQTQSGPFYHVTIPWEGRNLAQEAVRQGPYLLRVKTADAHGRPEKEEVLAFVLKR